MDELVKYSEQTFEAIKHINEYGEEFWYARELRKVLQYTEFNKFVPVIKKAMTACENSGYPVSDHFAQVSEKVEIGSGAFRNMDSFALSRYACYLIVMCADETKEVVALGKTYFAVKTRQQELIEEYDTLSEDQKRLAIRNEMKQHNIALADAAKNAGVINQKDYAIFQNMGYKGLYGGLGAKEIHERKGLKKSQKITPRSSRNLMTLTLKPSRLCPASLLTCKQLMLLTTKQHQLKSKSLN